jgi:hypothetical protein
MAKPRGNPTFESKRGEGEKHHEERGQEGRRVTAGLEEVCVIVKESKDHRVEQYANEEFLKQPLL